SPTVDHVATARDRSDPHILGRSHTPVGQPSHPPCDRFARDHARPQNMQQTATTHSIDDPSLSTAIRPRRSFAVLRQSLPALLLKNVLRIRSFAAYTLS